MTVHQIENQEYITNHSSFFQPTLSILYERKKMFTKRFKLASDRMLSFLMISTVKAGLCQKEDESRRKDKQHLPDQRKTFEVWRVHQTHVRQWRRIQQRWERDSQKTISLSFSLFSSGNSLFSNFCCISSYFLIRQIRNSSALFCTFFSFCFEFLLLILQ